MNKIKMRTARSALEELKKVDPDTAISERMIRDIIRDERIPVIRQGSKALINMNDLNAYLAPKNE